ncbi:MAG: FAD-dependent oxidoreductase [Dehalococcoidia bacterium]
MTAPGAPAQFQHLFTPLKIGSFTVRNRIMSTAHFTGFAGDGVPSERHIDYWVSKAKGGIGLIMTEVQPVHPSSGTSDAMILAYRDDCIEPFRRLVEAVHEHGARIVAQLWHAGNTGSSQYDGLASWAPSPSPSMLYGETPHEMTVEEIGEVVEGFAAAAVRMKEAGLDGLEIHGAHGYLVEEFLSPLYNQRTDEYGGTEENRVRFALEVIDAVREAVGPDYTLGIRITGDEFTEGGLTLEDMKRITPWLVEAGKLDYVNVSFYGGGGVTIAPMYVPPAQFVYLAAGIKEVVDVPVFCIGRINDPATAEEIVAKNQADMVGMTRANIADPELPNKAREGRLDEIRYCIACNEGCWGRVTMRGGISCAINPSVGREKEMEITPAATKKKVMVVGGGIAGLEAARVAALRGHSVSLYEKGEQLGGQLLIAARAPGRQDMAEPVRYYEQQFKRLGVEVHLSTSVSEEMILREGADAVILATGGLPGKPDVPGIDSPMVVQARDVLTGIAEAGQNVVVYCADHGMEGLSTADFMAEQGRKVELVTPYPSFGANVEMITNMFVRGRLLMRGAVFTPLSRLVRVEEGAVVVSNAFLPIERRLEGVDTLVLAMGSMANDALFKSLHGKVKELYTAGQCVSPRKMLESTYDGLRVGRTV